MNVKAKQVSKIANNALQIYVYFIQVLFPTQFVFYLQAQNSKENIRGTERLSISLSLVSTLYSLLLDFNLTGIGGIY
jgi:hypothetical protein